MSISVDCPQCGRRLKVDDKFGGKTGRCPACRATMQIPAASAAVRQPFAPEPPSDDDDLYGLAQGAVAPALPPRSGQSSDEVPPKRSKPKSAKGSASKARGGSTAAKTTGWGGAIFVGFLILRIVLRMNRGHVANNAPNQGVAAPPPIVVAAAPASPPSFSPRGEGQVIQPGVRFFLAKASGSPNVATTTMTIWVYLPDGPHEPHSLPCVAVAPAGSTVVTGMDLGDGDRAEHFPYVPAGYAVLSYSIDGYVENTQDVADARFKEGAAKFIAARAGLSNAKTAIDWMLKNFPEVDPDRLFTAGHSSAGTMALLLAENDARIKACAAFAPKSDTEGSFNFIQRAAVRQLIAGIDQIFTTFNPTKHAAEMKCPVLLFHAQDDSVVPVSETEAFAAALKSAGKEVTVALVPSGDHHDPMLSQGIPRAIAFFAAHGSGAQPAP